MFIEPKARHGYGGYDHDKPLYLKDDPRLQIRRNESPHRGGRAVSTASGRGTPPSVAVGPSNHQLSAQQLVPVLARRLARAPS